MATYYGVATGTTPGIYGETYSTITANGVKGLSSNGWSAIYGVATQTAVAVHGASSGTGWAVYADGGSNGAIGLQAYGEDNAVIATGGPYNTYSTGVVGSSSSLWGVGIRGVIGGDAAWAGFFHGNVTCDDLYATGVVYKPGGGFLIDHPLDPMNKSLIHSFVESPERKNIYDGVGSADSNGELAVTLPAYFESLNTDFRYQLTPIGASAPGLHVKQELSAGTFIIAGLASGQKVSWQITGNRKDAWALANPMVAEPEKDPEWRGRFWQPEAIGEPRSKRIYWQDFDMSLLTQKPSS